MAENRNKIKIRIKAGILISIVLFWGGSKFLSVYASEFGGFDVSTGTGAFDTDWSDWDDESADNEPEQGNSENYTDDIRDNGQQTNGNTAGSAVTDNSGYESRTSDNWSGQEYSESSGNADSFYDQNYADEYDWQSSNENGGASSNETTDGNEISNDDMAEAAYSEVPTPTLLPTDTPVPVPTPTVEPTVTPTPAFTEVPREEVNTVTEYKEEYRLPPTECLRKMKLLYWNRELPGGKYAEIQIKKEVAQMIVSVRINGQEKDWQTETKAGVITLKIFGLSEKRNHVELTVMVPVDLAWTRNEKNVILTYNVF